MKKGFTFAELMISLVIISVISAILYPTIADLAPNENAALFKSAYRSMSMALAEVMNDTSDGVVPHGSTDALCTEMARKLNVKENKCSINNTFTTSNGMRWYVGNTMGAGGPNDSPVAPIIIIDVAASNNTVASEGTLSTTVKDAADNDINVSAAAAAFTTAFCSTQGGCVDVAPLGATGGQAAAANREKIQDTFIFAFGTNGQLLGMDDVGYVHIEGK